MYKTMHDRLNCLYPDMEINIKMPCHIHNIGTLIKEAPLKSQNNVGALPMHATCQGRLILLDLIILMPFIEGHK
jgi:hypothetical protein